MGVFDAFTELATEVRKAGDAAANHGVQQVGVDLITHDTLHRLDMRFRPMSDGSANLRPNRQRHRSILMAILTVRNRFRKAQ